VAQGHRGRLYQPWTSEALTGRRDPGLTPPHPHATTAQSRPPVLRPVLCTEAAGVGGSRVLAHGALCWPHLELPCPCARTRQQWHPVGGTVHQPTTVCLQLPSCLHTRYGASISRQERPQVEKLQGRDLNLLPRPGRKRRRNFAENPARSPSHQQETEAQRGPATAPGHTATTPRLPPPGTSPAQLPPCVSHSFPQSQDCHILVTALSLECLKLGSEDQSSP
jgi:hypothetical protein